jgi:hypothetical protein
MSPEKSVPEIMAQPLAAGLPNGGQTQQRTASDQIFISSRSCTMRQLDVLVRATSETLFPL